MAHMPQHTAVATIHTNHGDIVVNLFGDQAPRTVKNFIGLADGSQEWTDPATGKPGEGALYTDVIFHRIIPNFMIQGGDPLGQGIGGPGYNFDDEISPELDFQKPYILAMANAGLRRNAITGKAEGTNGSQFFITTDPTPWLQGKHTIFGEVADDASRQVVDTIASVKTGAQDRPVDPVVISSIDVVTV
ncbi:peptidyl-prolyl cis-trans isomerase [Microbacterium sp. AISO3]|jgi:peptidyl-prolyl cis-trans isomerase A (cyclophilin A)|uniref:Peptidyl-prolyl cis-trans isomerase n=2 Tax=Microbacterium TaxID=33882 RepID=A0ABU1I2U2_9MICO|nr:peptidyl-prolyl cis-trans isomerase A (cyclophilin A) [Microbacterium paludicola]OWP20386.1 peptidyl-prolyl cis-trans isomerase [Microbacterium sp. AISO3]POX68338.1 peptidylprolyl isomerase [Microbacterium sp. Ru50]QCR38992.1 peptidylprolyl isomerase [Microbacterium sp. SGAir0570]GAD34545.1 peptidyl-prolyl cis-trans isomerase [Microbacterium sp. TS-1]